MIYQTEPMTYTQESIYTEVGRDDRTVTVNFKSNSDAVEQYDQSITGVFIYTQLQREDLDNRLKDSAIRSLPLSNYPKFFSLKRAVQLKAEYAMVILSLRLSIGRKATNGRSKATCCSDFSTHLSYINKIPANA